eukprot:TRINITY_DN28748_c0_g1_i1.p3 TRINITY_DN28748_c0_g1~~TRINITY_DN28748_c0_g1_i1.p3  ORF type:complete len:121 (+),score=9.16 TRINITY_DN28748_c0_g1_i1:538-900(+)
MTLKTISGLRWASKHCESAKYVMKVDTDIWLNLPHWRRLMFGADWHRLQSVVFGHCRRQPTVIRLPLHKYAVSTKVVPALHHPSFCRGPSYAMSSTLAAQIANATPSLLSLSRMHTSAIA